MIPSVGSASTLCKAAEAVSANRVRGPGDVERLPAQVDNDSGGCPCSQAGAAEKSNSVQLVETRKCPHCGPGPGPAPLLIRLRLLPDQGRLSLCLSWGGCCDSGAGRRVAYPLSCLCCRLVTSGLALFPAGTLMGLSTSGSEYASPPPPCGVRVFPVSVMRGVCQVKFDSVVLY